MRRQRTLTDNEVARRAIALIDLTALDEGDEDAGIDALCRRASAAGTAAVCVWPRFVARCRDRLAESGTVVATVVNFPLGSDDIPAARIEARNAVASGAQEIDLVMPYGSWLSGERESAREMISEVKAVCGGTVLLKVILETGKLRGRERVRAASLDAIDAGADFLKTSTGKIRIGATPTAARIMLQIIRGARRSVGFKAAGGIRTVRQAANYLRLADEIMGREWAGPRTFRFGASHLLDACERALN